MTINIESTANAVWTATRDWQDAPDHVTAWIGANFIGEVGITAPEALETNDTYTIASGLELPFTITPTEGTAGQADAAFIAMMGSGNNLTFRLHKGDPGNAHTANELTAARNAGYARKAVNYRTVAA